MMENFSVKSQSGGPPQGEKIFNAFLHHLEPIQNKIKKIYKFAFHVDQIN